MYTVPLGSSTTLGGEVVHAGSEDVESLDINWGDNSQDDTVSNGGSCAQFGISCDPNLSLDSANQFTSSGHIHLPFLATHTYANVGTYTATVTATDQSGTKTTTTVKEAALYSTHTSVSSSAPTSVYGQPVTFTATVSATGTSTAPTGTVTFYDGTTSLGTGTLSTSNGVTTATVTSSSLTVSTTHSITAAYGGDGGNAFGGSATPSALPQTVNPAATSTILTSKPNPSVWGQSATFTTTISVKIPGAGTPGGTVEFKDGAADISGCGSQPVDTTTETATCTTSALSVAGHTVSASYGGDVNFNGSTTASALTQTVNRASTATGVNSANNPSIQGSNVSFTSTISVTAPGAGTPTGTVTIKDGATTLGTGTLNTIGNVTTATVNSSVLSVGAHSITAAYAGNSNFLASSSTPITQYVDTNLSSYPKLSTGAFNLNRANLSRAFLVDANLTGARLIQTNLNRSNLTNANLTGANLTLANLSNANLMFANLTGADLTGANLSNADLSHANFTAANFTAANLTGANLDASTGMSTATLTGVIWNRTTCPDGSNSRAHGNTCVGHL